jgi:ABC-type phosphate/phosphonate transport system substrate-binding protein
MYSLPETAEAEARWWQGLVRHLRAEGVADIPERLTWPEDAIAHWRAPDLLLSQTCGYPLTHDLAGAVRYVATPHYAAAGCVGPDYCSRVVVRTGEADRPLAGFEGRRLAYNGLGSQSGVHALHALLAGATELRDDPFFAEAMACGAHRAALAAVRAGRADLCAVDAVTFALLQRHAPAELEGLATIAWTPTAPGLPFVTAATASPGRVEALRRALAAAIEDPARDAVARMPAGLFNPRH